MCQGCDCPQALEEQLRALRDSAAAVAARRERVAAQLEAGVPEPVEALAHAQAALAAAHQLQVPHSSLASCCRHVLPCVRGRRYGFPGTLCPSLPCPKLPGQCLITVLWFL